MIRPRRTQESDIALRALKGLATVAILGGVIWWAFFVNGCSKTPATFTPLVAAPDTIVDAQVMADAANWAARSPDRYWATTADTRSMEPFFTAKSVPLLVRYTGQTVANGTIAVFNRGDKPRVMHVISDQTATHVYMSGYNNHQSDGWFPKTAIEGIVVGQLYRP